MKGAHDVIIRPIISEKSYTLLDNNKYTFEVHPKAHKTQVRKAVEEIFNVKVRDVQTLVVHGKVKRMGAFQGKRPDWKKAVVTLEEGQSIDLFEQV